MNSSCIIWTESTINKEIMNAKALDAIKNFRLIDDTFMSIVFDDKDTAEFLIQLLLNDNTMIIQ